MRERAWPWQALLAGVLVWFFHETLLAGHSLVPTDLLHQILLPFGNSVTNVSVVNHYAMDALTFDYPMGVFWQQTVRTGELPLWNPHILGGHPYLADTMAAALSPFKALYLIASAERAMSLGYVLQIFMAGFFMFALLRELKRSPCAAFIGSCAWALNSSFLLWYWRSPAVFCWAPLVLLLYEHSVRRRSWTHAAGAGFVLGIALLSGSIQAGTHLGFLCTGYFAASVFWRDSEPRATAIGRAILILSIGVLISVAQTVPALELLTRDGYRSISTRGAWASVRHTVLGIPALITFVFPALTGSVESYDLLKLAQATRYDFTGYIGIIPFTLFLVGTVVARERPVRVLLLVGAAVMVIVFFTPFVKYVYHRFFIVMVFAMCVVSAYGADAVLASTANQVTRIRRVWLTMAVLCGLVLGLVLAAQVFIAWKHDWVTAMAQRYVSGRASGAAFPHKTEWFRQRVFAFLDHYRVSNVEFWLPALSVFLAGAAWVACYRQKLNRSVLAAALAMLTVVDLTVLGQRVVPQIDLVKYPLQPQHPTLTAIENDHELFRIHRWAKYSVYVHRAATLLPYGIDDVYGNFSLAPETVDALQPELPSVTNLNTIFDLQNAKYLFAATESPPAPPEHFALLAEADGVRVYRNLHFLPRLFFVPNSVVIPNHSEVRARMDAPDFDPRHTVFLEQTPTVTGNSSATGTVVVTRYSGGHVAATVTASGEGFLVVGDTFYPGWQARVDNVPVTIYRANNCMRAVPIAAGTHNITMDFRPPLFYASAAVSALAAAIAGAWWLIGYCVGLRHNT